MDGRMVDWDKAKIHVVNHSLHYGSGVFEGIRFYMTDKGPAIFRLKEHIDRLLYSAKCMGMKLPYTKNELIEACRRIVKVNKLKEGYIRPLCFYGYGKMGLNPVGAPVNVTIVAWAWGSYFEGDKKLRVKTSRFCRIHPYSSCVDAKISGHYVNSILANLSVEKSKYDEALLLDHQGNLAEGPGENLFLVRDGKLLFPELGSILPGITRDTIKTIATDLGIELMEKTLKLKDIYAADEAFFCGTAVEVAGIGSLDGEKIGDGSGEITETIKKIYLDAVHGKIPKYKKWVTLV